MSPNPLEFFNGPNGIRTRVTDVRVPSVAFLRVFALTHIDSYTMIKALMSNDFLRKRPS